MVYESNLPVYVLLIMQLRDIAGTVFAMSEVDEGLTHDVQEFINKFVDHGSHAEVRKQQIRTTIISATFGSKMTCMLCNF